MSSSIFACLNQLLGHPVSSNGKIRSLTQGNGNVFDQLLNERQLTSSLASTYGDDFNYLYDGSGKITTIDAVANNAYDRTLTYDGADRLKTASGPWGTGTYTYDTLGNIKSKTLGSRVVDVMYNSLNRVDQVRDSGVSSSWRTYLHDARGNVSTDGVRTFTYDDSNEPTSISGSGAGTYTYDGNLRRVKTVSGGQTTYTFYDRAGNLLGRNNRTTAKKTDYLSVGAQTFARVTNGVASYPINDHLGTALWVAAQNGVIQTSQTYNYNPSGEAVVGSGTGHLDEQGFTGHVEDSSGLTYMQARYYDPVVGRFLSADPIGYGDGLNLYAYVHNDPANRVDPTGTESPCFGSPCGPAPPPPTWQEAGEFALDFTPVGDAKAIVETAEHPTVLGVIATIVGIIPGAGDALGKGLRRVEKAIESTARTSRSARREAMRLEGIPTSRPATSQSGKAGNRQLTVDGADGNPTVVTQHPPDGQHPNPHWHAADPKIDPLTGEMRTNSQGQIKYRSDGSVVEYQD